MKKTVLLLVLGSLILTPSLLFGITRIEGEYQLQLDVRKQDRFFPWDFESNSYDTWAASQFRIFAMPRTGIEAFVRFEGDWNPGDNYDDRPRYLYRESHLRFLKQLGESEIDAYLFSRQDRFWVENYLIQVVQGGSVKDGDNAQGVRLDVRRFKGFDATYIVSDFSNQSKVGGGVTVPPPSDDAHIFRLRRTFLDGDLRTGMTWNHKVEAEKAEDYSNSVIAGDMRYTFRNIDFSLEYADSRRTADDAPGDDGFHFSDFALDNFSAALPRDAALKAEIRSFSFGNPKLGYYNVAPLYYYFGPDFADYLGEGTSDLVGYKINTWYLIPKRAVTLTFDYEHWEKYVWEHKTFEKYRVELYTEYVNGFTSKFWYDRNKTTDTGNPLFEEVTKNYDLFAEVQVENRLAWMRVQGKLKDLETTRKKELVSLETAVNITPYLKIYNRYAFGNDPARLRKGLFSEIQYRPQQHMELFVSYGPFWIGDDAIPVNDGDLAGGADNKDMFRVILKGYF